MCTVVPIDVFYFVNSDVIVIMISSWCKSMAKFLFVIFVYVRTCLYFVVIIAHLFVCLFVCYEKYKFILHIKIAGHWHKQNKNGFHIHHIYGYKWCLNWNIMSRKQQYSCISWLVNSIPFNIGTYYFTIVFIFSLKDGNFFFVA